MAALRSTLRKPRAVRRFQPHRELSTEPQRPDTRAIALCCGGRPQLLDAYRHHLCRRIGEGVTHITAVWHELRAQGFKGSRGTELLAMARAYAVSSTTDSADRPGRRASTPSAQRAYAWLVGWDESGKVALKRAEHRQFCDALCAIEPEIAEASCLAREFLGLSHRRDLHGFDRWLARARSSNAPELRRLRAA